MKHKKVRLANSTNQRFLLSTLATGLKWGQAENFELTHDKIHCKVAEPNSQKAGYQGSYQGPDGIQHACQ